MKFHVKLGIWDSTEDVYWMLNGDFLEICLALFEKLNMHPHTKCCKFRDFDSSEKRTFGNTISVTPGGDIK